MPEEKRVVAYGVILANDSQERVMYGGFSTEDDAQACKKALEAQTPYPWAVATITRGGE